MKKSVSNITSSFGARLRTLRLAKGITPRQFSIRTGIDTAALRQYEKGELEPKLTAMVVMARALEVDLAGLTAIDVKDTQS